MQRRIAVLVSAVGAVGPAAAAPTMVYGQRPGQIEGGYILSTAAGATGDDFVLDADTSLLSAQFWAFANGGGTLPNEITLAIWADEGSGNGVDDAGLIFEQTFAQSELDPTTDFGFATRFTADFASAIELDADTMYWFSIGFKVDALDYAWVIQGPSSPDPLGTLPVDYDENYDGWDGPLNTGPGGGLAFSLTGEEEGNVIPLPSAAALAGIGMGAAALRRRRASM